MNCPYCKKPMKRVKDKIEEDNVEFQAFRCEECGEELMNMNQLARLTDQYKKLKKAREIKFSKWGNSIAVRISKDFIKDFSIKPGKSALMYKDGKELRILIS